MATASGSHARVPPHHSPWDNRFESSVSRAASRSGSATSAGLMAAIAPTSPSPDDGILISIRPRRESASCALRCGVVERRDHYSTHERRP